MAATLAPPAVNTALAFGDGAVPADPDLVTSAEVARHFAFHLWSWYSDLLLAAGDHPAMELDFLSFPVTLVGGIVDVAAATGDIAAVTARIPQARFVPLLGTHFLPFEQRDRLHHELVELVELAPVPARQPRGAGPSRH